MDAAGEEWVAAPHAQPDVPPARGDRPLVYVYGLTDKVNDRHLDEIFGQYGRIIRLRVRRGTVSSDPDTLRRSALLEFERWEDAEKAVEHMDRGQIDGVYVRVTLHEDTARNSPATAHSPSAARIRPWGRTQEERAENNDLQERRSIEREAREWDDDVRER